MEKLIDCQICFGHYHVSREHCPYCGAQRVFIASHCFESLRTRITYRSAATNMRCELVRAYRSDLAFKFIVQ